MATLLTAVVDDDPLRASLADASAVSAATGATADSPSSPHSAGEPAVRPLEDAEGIAVVRRVDFAPILDHASDSFVADDALLGTPELKIDVSPDAQVIAGLRSALFTTRDDGDPEAAKASQSSRVVASIRRGSDASAPSAVCVNLQSLQLLSDGSELQLDDDEHVTDVKWIGAEYFGTSYSSGILRIFSRAGKLVFEQVRYAFDPRVTSLR